MDKRGALIIFAILTLFIFGAGVWFLTERSTLSEKSASLSTPVSEAGGAESETRAPAPVGITVPEKNAAGVPRNVAVPQAVGIANFAGSSNYRSFILEAKNGSFVPDTVIVREKDTLHIDFRAVDKDYDFTQPDYGFKVTLPRGQEKFVEFGATVAGKFTFFCGRCGGPEKGSVGYIVIAPK